MTVMQTEFVIRACHEYINQLKENAEKVNRKDHLRYESALSKEQIKINLFIPRIESELKAAERQAKPFVDNTPKSGIRIPETSATAKTEGQRTMEILKRDPVGIECINTFREGEVCGHDRAHHFSVRGKKNAVCRIIGCPCDNFTAKLKTKPYSNNLGLGFDDFRMETASEK